MLRPKKNALGPKNESLGPKTEVAGDKKTVASPLAALHCGGRLVKTEVSRVAWSQTGSEAGCRRDRAAWPTFLWIQSDALFPPNRGDWTRKGSFGP